MDTSASDGPDLDEVCWDEDGDGHWDVACGGDDCDDSRADVYAGADEVCMDGIDQDCDGIIDGPMAMMDELRITDEPDDSQVGTLVWTGSEYVLSWVHVPLEWPHVGPVKIVHITGDGSLSGSPQTFSSEGSHYTRPSLAWTGSHMGLLADIRGDIAFWSLSPSGDVLHTEDWNGWNVSSGIVWLDGMYGIVANAGSMGLHLVTFEEDAFRYATFTQIRDDASYYERSDLVWTGSEIVGTFSNDISSSGADWNINLARFDVDGSMIGDVVGITEYGSSSYPKTAWTGSELGVTFLWPSVEPYAKVYFSRLTARLEVTSLDLKISEYPSWDQDIVWTGSRYAIGWVEGPEQDRAVTVSILEDGAGAAEYYVHVSEELRWAAGVTLAWTGSELGMAWSDSRTDESECENSMSTDPICNYEVYFTRVGFCE